MAINFEIAKNALSETDKNRLLCLYLNCEQPNVNWEKATADFGAASIDSMKVMTRSVMKKIENAGGKEGVEAKPGKAAGGGRKRKATTDAVDDEGAVNGDGEAPAKKKRGRKPKKESSPVVEDPQDEESGDAVKKEEVTGFE